MSSTCELTPKEIAGLRLADLRRRRGITAEQLSARCVELGASHLTRNMVANIENRRRGVQLDDFLILSLALDVAPVDLLSLSEDNSEIAVLTSTVTVTDATTWRGWLVGETALPESNLRLYYASALEHMQAPTGQAMSAYAKAVVQERAAEIASQYEAEATAMLERTRTQASDLLDEVSKAVTEGMTTEEILTRLNAIRQRIRTTN